MSCEQDKYVLNDNIAVVNHILPIFVITTTDFENHKKIIVPLSQLSHFLQKCFLYLSALNLAKMKATEASEHGLQMVIQRVLQQLAVRENIHTSLVSPY